VISEFVKPRPNAAVLEWLDQRDETGLYLSVLTLGEIRKGIEKLPNTKRRRALQAWLDQDLTPRFDGRILDITLEVALAWGAIQGQSERSGSAIPVIDALIAATALTYDLTVVTRNESDMSRSGAIVFDPWRVALG
jgi:predicted nucleic acid-binding protein